MDARTRELERRWRESGDRGAGVRYLQALVRSGARGGGLLRARLEVGELAPERLHVAALLGDADACGVIDPGQLELTTADLAEIAQVKPGVVRRWIANDALPSSGRRGNRYVFDPEQVIGWSRGAARPKRLSWLEVCGWACPEALWALLLALARRYAREVEPKPGPVLEAVEAWCNEPGPAAQQRVTAAVEALPQAGGDHPQSRRQRLSRSLPPKTRHEPLHASEVLAFAAPEVVYGSGLDRSRLRELLLPWALAFDFEGALEARSSERARLPDELSRLDAGAIPVSVGGPEAQRRPAGLRSREGLGSLSGLPSAAPQCRPVSGAAAALAADLAFGVRDDALAWFRGLGRHGAQPILRALVAVARCALASWREARPDDVAGDAVVLALEHCVRAPGSEAVGGLRATAEPMRQAVLKAGQGRRRASVQALACGHVISDAALVLRADSSVEDLVRDASETAALALGRVSYARGEALTPRALVQAVQQELMAWAHGHDPLEG